MKKIQFLGDIFLKRAYEIDIELDHFIANLEYVATDKKIGVDGKVNLRSRDLNLIETFGKKPLAVCLANNHFFDFDKDGAEDCIKKLNQADIPYFGAGNLENNFNNPFSIEIWGKKIHVFGYCCETTHPFNPNSKELSLSLLNKERVLRDISKFKRSPDDFIVLNIHWGAEEISFPRYEDSVLAKEFVNAGANLIIGHHAHVIQSTETYKNTSIYYGIGNFIFPDLEEESFFSSGTASRIFVKKQSEDNKKSLIVELDNDFNTSEKITYFDGCRVKNSTLEGKRSGYIPKSKRAFNFRVQLILRTRMALNFLKTPRMIKFNDFKRLLKGRKI